MALGYVRTARPDEADAIARIQLATWRTAYRRLLPRHVLDELDEQFLAQRWRAAIEAPPSHRHRVLVAVEQAEASHLVGFTASGPADEDALAPDEDGLGPDVAAVTELLVEPRWGRRGHGSRLLAASVDLWREDGFSTAVAWAYDDDTAMLKFLTSAGWAPDGARRALDVDDLLVPQQRLHVSAEGASGSGAAPSGLTSAARREEGASERREASGRGSVEQSTEPDGEPGPADD